jgi:hypothetical protein
MYLALTPRDRKSMEVLAGEGGKKYLEDWKTGIKKIWEDEARASGVSLELELNVEIVCPGDVEKFAEQHRKAKDSYTYFSIYEKVERESTGTLGLYSPGHVAAHEIGHKLWLPEEYHEESRHDTQWPNKYGLDTLMGHHYENQAVPKRYFDEIWAIYELKVAQTKASTKEKPIYNFKLMIVQAQFDYIRGKITKEESIKQIKLYEQQIKAISK